MTDTDKNSAELNTIKHYMKLILKCIYVLHVFHSFLIFQCNILFSFTKTGYLLNLRNYDKVNKARFPRGLLPLKELKNRIIN